MQKDLYDRIIGFLQGASWGIILFGALMTFQYSIFFGVPIAIFFTMLYLVVSLFLVLLLDAFSVNKKRLEEAKKQTKLLEKLYAKHTKS